MAEIKVEEGLSQQISSFRKAGQELTGKAVSLDDASSLPTCKAYRERCRQLSELLTSFGKLVEKDAREIQEFMDKMKQLDQS